MATYYVSSVDGSDADTGADWANAKATVAGALAVATTTGDVILVDSAHAYTAGAAITWTPSTGIHLSIISTDRTNGGVLAGAAESVGAANGTFNIMPSVSGSLYLQGLTLTGGTNNNANCLFQIALGSNLLTRFVAKDCSFVVPTAHASGTLILGPGTANDGSGQFVFEGCTIQGANNAAAEYINFRTIDAEFIDCTFTQTSANLAAVFVNSAAEPGRGVLRFTGCDLSAFGGANIGDVTGLNAAVHLNDCKLNASTSLAPTGTWPTFGASGSLNYTNCDDSDTTYQFNHYSREGAITVDLATYASDAAEVDANPLSWKIVTTADADEDSPFVTPWVSTWIDSTGSKTLSLELLYDNASNYDDREIWAEIEYLGNASFPLSTVYSSRNANPFTGTGTDLTAGSATWTEALTNDNKDKITTTVTVNGKGLARARLFVAVASTTIYLDPQLRVA